MPNLKSPLLPEFQNVSQHGGPAEVGSGKLHICRRLAQVLVLAKGWPLLIALALLSVLESVIVAQVGKVAGRYYAILLDFQPALFAQTTVHAGSLYVLCAVLAGLGTLLQRRLALDWRGRLTKKSHAAYLDGICLPVNEKATCFRPNPSHFFEISRQPLPPPFFFSTVLDNPDQRIAKDTRDLCDDLSAIMRVVVSLPFRFVYYSWFTARYIRVWGLGTVTLFFLSGSLAQAAACRPVAHAVVAQESAEGDLRTGHARLRAARADVALAGQSVQAARFPRYATEHDVLDRASQEVLNLQRRLAIRGAALDCVTKLIGYAGALVTYAAVAIVIFTGRVHQGTSGVTAEFISNAVFFTMALIYSFSELVNNVNQYSRVPGLLARVGELLEALLEIEASEDGDGDKTSAPGSPAEPDRSERDFIVADDLVFLGLATEDQRLIQNPKESSSSRTEVTVHHVPRGSPVFDKICSVFPEAPRNSSEFLACLTMQPVTPSPFQTVEESMNIALEHVRGWAEGLRRILEPRGFWADAVDPRTGTPLLGPASSDVWAETEAIRMLHPGSYPIIPLGPCPVVLHPVMGSGAYPATLVTNAPWDVLRDLLEVMVKNDDYSINMSEKDINGNTSQKLIPSPITPHLLTIHTATLRVPGEGRLIVQDLDLRIDRGQHTLVLGPNGSGKSSLLAALGGLLKWEQAPVPAEIIFGAAKHVMWQPQRPVLAPSSGRNAASLWRQLVYPRHSPRPDNVLAINALEAVGLGALLQRVGSLDGPTPRGLSPGEIQRLCFARILLSRPDLAVLDEPTAALPPSDTRHLFGLLHAAGTTCLTAGQGETELRAAHVRHVVLQGTREGSWVLHEAESN